MNHSARKSFPQGVVARTVDPLAQLARPNKRVEFGGGREPMEPRIGSHWSDHPKPECRSGSV